MTALRMAAHRAGWLRATVPQSIEQSLARRAGLSRSGGPATHQAAAELLHLGYAAGQAALFTLIPGQLGRSTLVRGAALAGGVWGLSMVGLAPLTRLTRLPWRAGIRENLVDLSAHATYGLVAVLVAEELRRQAVTGEPQGGARERLA